MEAVGHEAESDARNPSGRSRARQSSQQTESAVGRKGKGRHRRQAVDGERRDTGRVQGEERQRNAVVVLGEGQRVVVGIKDSRVEKARWLIESSVIIPPECVSDGIWVAGIGDRVAPVPGPRPRHHNGHKREGDDYA